MTVKRVYRGDGSIKWMSIGELVGMGEGVLEQR